MLFDPYPKVKKPLGKIIKLKMLPVGGFFCAYLNLPMCLIFFLIYWHEPIVMKSFTLGNLRRIGL